MPTLTNEEPKIQTLPLNEWEELIGLVKNVFTDSDSIILDLFIPSNNTMVSTILPYNPLQLSFLEIMKGTMIGIVRTPPGYGSYRLRKIGGEKI